MARPKPSFVPATLRGAAESGNENVLMNNDMKYPKLGFRNASVPQQLDIAGRLARGAGKLPSELRAKIFHADLVETLGEAEDVGKELALLRDRLAATASKQKQIMARLRDNAKRCSNCLWAFSAGDAATLLGAGQDLEKSKRVRTGPPSAPTQLRVRERDGAIELLWRTPMRRCWYRIEIVEGSPGEEDWRSHRDWSCGKGRFTFQGLKPNTAYWFRVKAFNANGESLWSDIVCGRPQ